jgi:hypothetical protein
MAHLDSSIRIFGLLETKLHYEPCLQNVSNTVKNRYKGNLTMKIDHFYWRAEFKHNAGARSESNSKKLLHTLVYF